MRTLKVLNEDTEEELRFDVEVQASKAEIQEAIEMLTELLTHEELPNEAIFVNTARVQIVRVTKID
mgnify:CR=1 FL=1